MIPRLLVNSRMSYQSLTNYIRSRTIGQVDVLNILAEINRLFSEAATAKRCRRCSLPRQTIKMSDLSKESVLVRFFDWYHGSTLPADLKPYMQIEFFFNHGHLVKAREYDPPVDPQAEYGELIRLYFGEISHKQLGELYESGHLKLLKRAHERAESFRPSKSSTDLESTRDARNRYLGAVQVMQDVVEVLHERIGKSSSSRYQQFN